MSDRISLQSALERMLETYRPWVACGRIVSALRDNRLRLYCEGTLLSPAYIQTQLHIVIEQEIDGRWRWAIRPAGMLGFAPGFDPKAAAWEVDAAGAEDLLPRPAKGRGRKSAHNWMDIVDQELVSLRSKGSPLLEDFEALCADLKAQIEQETGHTFKGNKRLRRRIRAFLQVQN
jgi:hypothetical protein